MLPREGTPISFKVKIPNNALSDVIDRFGGSKQDRIDQREFGHVECIRETDLGSMFGVWLLLFYGQLPFSIHSLLLNCSEELNEVFGEYFGMEVLFHSDGLATRVVFNLQPTLQHAKISFNGPTCVIESREISIWVTLVIEQRGEQDFDFSGTERDSDQSQWHRIGSHWKALPVCFSKQLFALASCDQFELPGGLWIVEQGICMGDAATRHPDDEGTPVMAVTEAEESTEITAVIECHSAFWKLSQMMGRQGGLAQGIGREQGFQRDPCANINELGDACNRQGDVVLHLSAEVLKECRTTRQVLGGAINGEDPEVMKAQTLSMLQCNRNEPLIEVMEHAGVEGHTGFAKCSVGDGLDTLQSVLEVGIEFALERALDLIEEEEDQEMERELSLAGEGVWLGRIGFMGLDEAGVAQTFKYL